MDINVQIMYLLYILYVVSKPNIHYVFSLKLSFIVSNLLGVRWKKNIVWY
jgi:hypothetical protein